MAGIELRFETDPQRLEVIITNTKPVVLTDLTLSLLAIGQQYESFIENDAPNAPQISAALLVKEVRTGSIIFELVAQAIPIVPLLWNGGPLAEWAKVATHMVMFFLHKDKAPPKAITKNDLKQWNNILEPIAKDDGSQMNMIVHDGGVVVQRFIINSVDANAAQNEIRRQLEKMEEPVDVNYRKRVMTWYQAKFDPDSQTGNKAKIESISKKPLRVVFDNNAIREEMFAQGSDFGVPWHKLAYIVDVQIQTIDEIPRVAIIMKYYPEETFNPTE